MIFQAIFDIFSNIGDERFRWNKYIDSGKPSLITRKTFKTITVNEEKTDSVIATAPVFAGVETGLAPAYLFA